MRGLRSHQGRPEIERSFRPYITQVRTIVSSLDATSIFSLDCTVKASVIPGIVMVSWQQIQVRIPAF